MVAFERQVLDALPSTIYTIDLDGRITSVNHARSRSSVNSVSLVRGASLWSAIGDAGTRAQIERALVTLREGRTETVRWECPGSAPDEERVFLMQVSPLRDGARITGYVFLTTDITDSHRARETLVDTGIALARTIVLEHVLQEAARQIRQTIGHDRLVVALADDATAALHVAFHSDPSGELVPAAATLDGPTADLVTMLEAELQPAWSEALASGQVVAHDTLHGAVLTAPMASSDGAIGVMTTYGPPIPGTRERADAKRVLAVVALQTAAAIERARLVQRLQHTHRLETIGEVAAGVAHEMRNPLFGISSAAQLLRFRTREDPVVEKNIGRILREVERLTRMLTSLLEYGRPSPLRLSLGDPDGVWNDVLEANRGRLEARALLLARQRAPTPVRCPIDPEQLSQVFLHILVNAVDAAPEASELTLSSSVLPNGAWRCRLHNGGPAIPPDVLARVFEIFYSTKPGGTGIGLSVCRRIVEEHGGSIALASAPGAGTTVTIVLPGTPLAVDQGRNRAASAAP